MIICEIGLNHLGDCDYADEYLTQILDSPADAVTFQLREKAFYADPAYAQLTLPQAYYKEASRRIRKSDAKLGVALADEEAMDFCEGLAPDFYKVLSQDITNFSLIDGLVRKTDKPLFVSTGMSNLDEIGVFFQHIRPHGERFTLIHTQLTQDLESVHLRAMPLLSREFSLPVAYGHHCDNLKVLYLSLAFSPSDVFFYVKGGRTSAHLDEEHAIALEDLAEVVNSMKILPASMGQEVKVKMDNEIEKGREAMADKADG
jgi:sialic acid synthase SpsE|tara:strand:- start:145 stop:921 length:777 start_codon:yes stop_codon:yes gene_type:complete